MRILSLILVLLQSQLLASNITGGGGGGGSGTVTSVNATESDPSPLFAVTGGAITTSGTLTLSYNNQPGYTYFGNGTSGSSLPNWNPLSSLGGNGINFGGGSLGIFPDGKTIQISGGKLVDSTSIALTDSTGLLNVTGSPLVGGGTLTLSSYKSQSANTFLANNTSSSAAPTFQALSSLAGNGVTYAGSSLGIFPDGKTIQLNASGQLVATATSSSGTGNVTGVASSTAGDMAYFSDTTGKAIADTTFLNVGPTSGIVSHTFGTVNNAGNPLFHLATGSAQNWPQGVLIDGTVSTTNPATGLDMMQISPTVNVASGASAHMYGINVTPTLSGTYASTGGLASYETTLSATNSRTDGINMQAGNQAMNYNLLGYAFNTNATTNTGAVAVAVESRGNLNAGIYTLARSLTGTSGHSYGGILTATTETSSKGVGLYSLIGTTYGWEPITTGPGFSAAIVADNTDTAKTVIAGLNNGTSLFAVENTYIQLGQNGTTTSTLNINNASVAAGAQTATYTNTAPRSGLTLKYLQTVINGSIAFIPYLQ